MGLGDGAGDAGDWMLVLLLLLSLLLLLLLYMSRTDEYARRGH